MDSICPIGGYRHIRQSSKKTALLPFPSARPINTDKEKRRCSVPRELHLPGRFPDSPVVLSILWTCSTSPAQESDNLDGLTDFLPPNKYTLLSSSAPAVLDNGKGSGGQSSETFSLPCCIVTKIHLRSIGKNHALQYTRYRQRVLWKRHKPTAWTTHLHTKRIRHFQKGIPHFFPIGYNRRKCRLPRQFVRQVLRKRVPKCCVPH